MGNYTKPLAIEGRTQVTPLVFSATTATQTAAFTNGGSYDVWSDVDCTIKVGQIANDLADLDTGYPLFANNVVQITVPTGSKIGVYAAAGGTLRMFPTGI